MPVPIPQPDGSTKMEVMTVDAIAADVIDNENGKILGKMREIFSDTDNTRQVKTTTPFKATLRDDQKGKKPFFEFRRPAPALRSVLEAWILDGMKRGHVQPWVSQCLLVMLSGGPRHTPALSPLPPTTLMVL